MYGGDTRGEGKKEGRDKRGRKPLLMTKISVARGREKRRNRERERERERDRGRERKQREDESPPPQRITCAPRVCRRARGGDHGREGA